MKQQFWNVIRKSPKFSGRINVTVHVGLRTCCADRRLNWVSEQKSHRRRRFSWIFVCCCERVNSNELTAKDGKKVAENGVNSNEKEEERMVSNEHKA